MQTTSAPIGLNVIIVDDEEDHLFLIRESVIRAYTDSAACDVQVFGFHDASEAVASLPPRGECVVLLDYRMPLTTGLDWIADFEREQRGPILICTSIESIQVATSAFRSGASDYLLKAQLIEEPQVLRQAIDESLRKFRMRTTNHRLRKELKLANSELSQRNSTLASLTETAHRFVDNVAHDFRTPLAVISEFAAILDDEIGGPVTPKQHEYLHYISDATRDLSQLIDDFLDSGRLRANTLRVDRRGWDVGQLLELRRTMLETRAASKSIELEFDIEPDLPMVHADADKVGRTLTNLVVNAIKFSPDHSTVTIGAQRTTDGGVRISVQDEGPGLPPNELSRMFERFQQGASGKAQGSAGFGLGLNIVRDLVRINLGSVDVASQPNEGMTIAFTLPRHDSTAVLRALLDRLDGAHKVTYVSALELSSHNPDTPMEDLRLFAAQNCHATDIQWVDERRRVVVLIGESGSPESWKTRLQELAANAAASAPYHSQSDLNIDVVGCWPSGAAFDALAPLLDEKLTSGVGQRPFSVRAA